MKYLLLIGAQKSGTTYLHNLLAQDKSIAAHLKKEPKYFAKPKFEGIDYHSMFEFSPGSSVVLDSSAAYLHVEGTAERAARHLGSEAVVVAVLRNPIERAVSAYLHSAKHGRDLRSAEEVFSLDALSALDVYLEENEKVKSAQRRGLIPLSNDRDGEYYDPVFHYRYVSNSFYRCQLDAYFDCFGTVLTIDFENLAAQPGRIADLVRSKVGLTDPVEYKLEVPRNVTKFNRWTSLRKNRAGGPTVHWASAAWRLFTQKYNTSHLQRICEGRWAETAVHDYQNIVRNID